MHFKAVEGQFRKEIGAWQVCSTTKMRAYLQRCMHFTLHRHLHCSQSFLPFPSPNTPLLDLFTCSLRSCSSCMSHGWEGSLFLTFPLLMKGSEHEKSCLLITFDCMQWRSLLSVQQTRDWEHFSGSASGQMSTAVTGEYIRSEEWFLWISLIKTPSLPKGQVVQPWDFIPSLQVCEKQLFW